MIINDVLDATVNERRRNFAKAIAGVRQAIAMAKPNGDLHSTLIVYQDALLAADRAFVEAIARGVAQNPRKSGTENDTH